MLRTRAHWVDIATLFEDFGEYMHMTTLISRIFSQLSHTIAIKSAIFFLLFLSVFELEVYWLCAYELEPN